MLANLLAVLVVAALPPDTTAQGVDYRIEASLDETTDVLTARAELTYTNNASVALDTLWLHQHLNAFRSNSAWATRDLQFGERRFQDLGPDEHAFSRLGDVEIDGERIEPVYPGAPDSTVVGFPLPDSLEPGATATVRMDWTARPATIPRRQGRRGRHYDFAQWYPRIAVFDEGGWHTQQLLPQGEFYGEFASYDVTLDLAADQVVGATGVPVEGDPGWSANDPTGREILYERDAYPQRAERDLGLLDDDPASGRKRIRWRAENVHHFAWSADPAFIHEGGEVARSGADGGTIAVHVLYLPNDSDWAGAALTRTIGALNWLQSTIGPYAWPQFTNLHRIESGGTEFPMLIMNGSPSEGLIIHESSHQYFHGMLANNEFRDGWLDEGFASFLANWYFEEQGQTGVWDSAMDGIRQYEQRGLTQPIATPGAEFRDPNTYSAMTYTKTSLVLRMLRWLIGEDAMREAFQTLYTEHALSHIDEQDLRDAVSAAAGEDLGWFFDQWLHTTDQLDYSIVSAATEENDDGTWTTNVEVNREGEAWMPVTLQVGDQTGRLSWRGHRQGVEVTSDERPTEVVIDPENILIDVDLSNNRVIPTAP